MVCIIERKYCCPLEKAKEMGRGRRKELYWKPIVDDTHLVIITKVIGRPSSFIIL